MNLDQMEGSLWQAMGKVKEQWGVLIGDSFVAAAGRRDQLVGKIQKRRGTAAQDAARQLEDFMQRNRNWDLLSRQGKDVGAQQ